jgi:hypothetical protein
MISIKSEGDVESITANNASVNFHSHDVTGCSVRVGFSTTYKMIIR